jgi:hypothetical protein
VYVSAVTERFALSDELTDARPTGRIADAEATHGGGAGHEARTRDHRRVIGELDERDGRAHLQLKGDVTAVSAVDDLARLRPHDDYTPMGPGPFFTEHARLLPCSPLGHVPTS